MIPPAPSEAGQSYPYLRRPDHRALTAASRGCAVSLGRETWPGLVAKTALFVLAGYGMYARAL